MFFKKGILFYVFLAKTVEKRPDFYTTTPTLNAADLACRSLTSRSTRQGSPGRGNTPGAPF
jgi:hypothetical protein